MKDEIEVNDTSILPQLENNGFWGPTDGKMRNGHYAISNNIKEVKRLYNWIGLKSPVEWSFADANTDFGRKGMIGTMHNITSGLTPRPNKNGLGNFSINYFSHTHYGTSDHEFQISGPDYRYAREVRLINPKAKFSVFMPLLTKETYNNAFKNKYNFKPIDYEPTSKFLFY